MALIRLISVDDLSQITRLQEEWRAEFARYEPWGILLSNIIGQYSYLAELDGQTVGYVAAQVRTKDGEHLCIEDLFVSLDYRNAGVGDLLLQRVLYEASRERITECRLTPVAVEQKLDGLIRFYTKRGFALISPACMSLKLISYSKAQE